jgi:DNA-binding NtrC family response regulator
MVGDLMSSQLFGHVAGAFTGANCDALGSFRAADQGTLFLDEIGELEYPLQAKLLRVLQEHVVTPVGSHECRCVDVRVVAATNRDLQSEVVSGRFREDLYYRLHVVHLKTSSLQERPEDICDLAEQFLERLADEGLPRCSLSPDATDVLLEFHWPGNVRQLRNVLEQAVIDSPSPVITGELLREIISSSYASPVDAQAANSASVAQQLPAQSASSRPQRRESDEPWLSLAQLERAHIVRTLKHTYFNRSAAARLLGVTRQSLLRKIKHYGLSCGGKPPR